MGNEIIKFLSKHITLSKEDKKLINDLNLIQSLKKGDFLLKQGEVSKGYYFVLKGCVRSYYLVDDIEQVTEFYFENQLITTVSYVQKVPSEYYLSCLEDSLIFVISDKSSKILLNKIPKIEILIRKMNEEILATQQIKFDNYVILTPEKRYLKLLNTRPDICQRVHQYQLASYLGIKPQSLCRIRKRLNL